MIGEFVSYLTADPPFGVLPCIGQTLSDAAYPQLAAAIDPAFDNGDGTFTLPDFRGRTMIGAGTGTGLTARNLGDSGGEETHTLTTAEIPSHAHTDDSTKITGVFVAPGEVPAVVSTLPGSTGNTGGGGAHNNMQPWAVGTIGVRYASPLMTNVTLQRTVGEIVAMARSSAPTGYLPCDGSSHLRTDYPELYAAIDALYKTDADHFVTPDLRGRTIIGAGTGSGLTARTINQAVGTETHALTDAQMPQHSHTIVTAGAAGNSSTTVARGNSSNLSSMNTGQEGSGTAHPNMQPSRVQPYYIVAQSTV